MTAIPTIYKTRGHDQFEVRSSANNTATVTSTSTNIAPSRMLSCDDTIQVGKNH